MRKFREFFYLNEVYYSGHFQFPDMGDKYDPTKAPVGGFKSLGQLQQFQRETNPEKKQLEQNKDLLDKLAALAENAYATWEIRKKTKSDGREENAENYMRDIDFDPETGILYQMPEKDVIGRYPSIKSNQLGIAINMNIMKRYQSPNPKGGGTLTFYSLDTKKLKQMMEETRRKSIDLERKFEKQNQLTGGVENTVKNVVNTALSGSNVPNFGSMPYQS
jgi:hypothetical protein